MANKISLDRLRLAEHLQPGDVITWPQGPGEPIALTELLVAQRAELASATLMVGLTASNTLRPELADRFSFLALNGAGSTRRITALAEIVPSHISTLPALIRSGTLRVDVALIQVRPLPSGDYTVGVICDFTQAMISQARTVIALVNESLPLTRQDAVVTAGDIDILVEGDDRIIDMPDPVPSPVEQAVAAHVAAVIPDRATVQLGVGTLPAAVAASLFHHKDLGVHSGVVTDVLVDLVERGVVTNAHKGRDSGLTVTGGLLGTRRLRDFAELSGSIAMRSVEYTHHFSVAATLPRFHTINSAIEIDLSAQVNSEVAGGRYLGAVGGQVDFVRAGMASPEGHSIFAFPSTTPDGKQSRIVASLGDRPVTTARSDVDIVITEYGVSHLRGCSLRERARRLAAIAHPDHREALLRAIRETPAD